MHFIVNLELLRDKNIYGWYPAQHGYFQNQSLGSVLLKRCSEKFRKVLTEITVLEFLFDKTTGLQPIILSIRDFSQVFSR